MQKLNQAALKAVIESNFDNLSAPFEQGHDGLIIVSDDKNWEFKAKADLDENEQAVLAKAKELGYPETTKGKRRKQAILLFKGDPPEVKVNTLNKRGKVETNLSKATAFWVIKPSGTFSWTELVS